MDEKNRENISKYIKDNKSSFSKNQIFSRLEGIGITIEDFEIIWNNLESPKVINDSSSKDFNFKKKYLFLQLILVIPIFLFFWFIDNFRLALNNQGFNGIQSTSILTFFNSIDLILFFIFFLIVFLIINLKIIFLSLNVTFFRILFKLLKRDGFSVEIVSGLLIGIFAPFMLIFLKQYSEFKNESILFLKKLIYSLTITFLISFVISYFYFLFFAYIDFFYTLQFLLLIFILYFSIPIFLSFLIFNKVNSGKYIINLKQILYPSMIFLILFLLIVPYNLNKMHNWELDHLSKLKTDLDKQILGSFNDNFTLLFIENGAEKILGVDDFISNFSNNISLPEGVDYSHNEKNKFTPIGSFPNEKYYEGYRIDKSNKEVLFFLKLIETNENKIKTISNNNKHNTHSLFKSIFRGDFVITQSASKLESVLKVVSYSGENTFIKGMILQTLSNKSLGYSHLKKSREFYELNIDTFEKKSNICKIEDNFNFMVNMNTLDECNEIHKSFGNEFSGNNYDFILKDINIFNSPYLETFKKQILISEILRIVGFSGWFTTYHSRFNSYVEDGNTSIDFSKII
jgi:hypothetical protein